MKSDKLFSFIVRYLAPLKFIPFIPHVFDSLIRVWMLLYNPALLDWIDEVEIAANAMEDVTLSAHKYGGVQFNYSGGEIGHLHSNGLLDILYTKAVKEKLKYDGLVLDHHIFRKSGWTSFYLRSPRDVSDAKGLLLLACEQQKRAVIK